ncbi:MAG: DUF4405 domain-containing protein [Anaerolineales bacterium]|nr:DUF4405 domain-containing protein [Anaerolineales bacterium]
MSNSERNFWLDLTLSIVYSITIGSGFLLWLVIPQGTNTAFAGIDRGVWLGIHIGSGFLGLMGVILHIVWHWRWLKALRGRPFRTLKKPVLANRVVNRMAWISFIASNVLGLQAWLLTASLPAESVKIFARFHVIASINWLVFLTAHLVLHQRWVASAARRYLPRGIAGNVKGNKKQAHRAGRSANLISN